MTMEQNKKSCSHVFFSGRVQGVFFRKTVWAKARNLGIKGWVKNLEDGRVEALFEGEKELITKLIENVGKGNPFIKVDDVELEWRGFEGRFDDFKIV